MKFPQLKTHNSKLFAILPFLLVGIFLVAAPAFAQSTALGNILGTVIGFIAASAIKVLGVFFGLLVQGIMWVGSFQDIINAPPVVFGWVVVRDIANMFFIVVLLFIAMGTLLGHEEYEWHKTLPRFVGSIILINFSKTIAGLFIDFSQVITLTFINAIANAGEGNFANLFGVEKFWSLNPSSSVFQGNDPFLVGAAMVFGAILLFIAVMVLAVILAILIFRLIILWFLVVLFPVAILAGAWPGETGHKYYKEWWENFSNYLMVGPVLSFFIWLALMSASYTKEIVRNSGLKPPDSTMITGITNIQSTDAFIGYVVGVGMLIVGLELTSKMGVVGSKLAGSALQWLEHAGTSILKGAGMVALSPLKIPQMLGMGAWNRVATAFWRSPLGMIASVPKAWEMRQEGLKEEAHKIAIARGQDFINPFVTGGKVVTDYETAARAHAEREYEKDYASLGRNIKAARAAQLLTMGGEEGRDRRRALMRAAFASGHVDDIMGSDAFREAIKEKLRAETGSDAAFEARYAEVSSSKQLIHAFMWDFMGQGEGLDQQDLRLLDEAEEEYAAKTGHWEYAGLSTTNAKGEREFVADAKKGAEIAATQLAKQKGRNRLGAAPHSFFKTATKNWKALDLGEEELIMLKAGFSGQTADEVLRYNPGRTGNMFYGGTMDSGSIDAKGFAVVDDFDRDFTNRIQKFFDIQWSGAKETAQGWWQSSGGKGAIKVRSKDGTRMAVRINNKLKELTQSNDQLDDRSDDIIIELNNPATSADQRAALEKELDTVLAERAAGDEEQLQDLILNAQQRFGGAPSKEKVMEKVRKLYGIPPEKK